MRTYEEINANNGYEQNDDSESAPNKKESQKQFSSRVEIFGTRASGAFNLSKEFESYLKAQGIEDASVRVSRNYDSIEDAFFGRLLNNNSVRPEDATVDGLRGAMAQKILKISNFLLRKAGPNEEIGVDEKTITERADDLPRGVIALPQMRYNDPHTGCSMNIDTPIEKIKELCDKYNVPMLCLEDIQDINQLREASNKLLANEDY